MMRVFETAAAVIALGSLTILSGCANGPSLSACAEHMMYGRWEEPTLHGRFPQEGQVGRFEVRWPSSHPRLLRTATTNDEVTGFRLDLTAQESENASFMITGPSALDRDAFIAELGKAREELGLGNGPALPETKQGFHASCASLG